MGVIGGRSPPKIEIFFCIFLKCIKPNIYSKPNSNPKIKWQPLKEP